MPQTLGTEDLDGLLARGRSYRSVSVVTAQRLPDDYEWTTPNGDALSAVAGDWLLSDGADQWSVADDVFAKSYRPIGDGRYEKTATVIAVRLDEPFAVQTLEGVATGAAGDWLVRNPTGESWPIPAATFAKRYEPE
jgi:hypothetical protein